MRFIIIYLLVFIYFPLYAQNDYIDYEKDTQWIKRLELMQGADKKKNIIELPSFESTTKLYSISIDYHPAINNNIYRYLSYKWLPKVIGLFEYYRPLFEEKLQEYGLPLELAFLPIVESNLNPQAKSAVGAEGLWQFMPDTGKKYGLAKNDKINLFFDPYMSTDSACRFLSYLYSKLQDWNLVLSAYNSGLGNVQKAIRKAGTTNYWSVRKYLPKETQAYVPTFHAILYIHKNYGLIYHSLPTLKYSFITTKELRINKTTTFKELSKKLKINIQTLYFLNPQIITETIPKNSFIYYISYDN